MRASACAAPPTTATITTDHRHLISDRVLQSRGGSSRSSGGGGGKPADDSRRGRNAWQVAGVGAIPALLCLLGSPNWRRYLGVTESVRSFVRSFVRSSLVGCWSERLLESNFPAKRIYSYIRLAGICLILPCCLVSSNALRVGVVRVSPMSTVSFTALPHCITDRHGSMLFYPPAVSPPLADAAL